MGLFHDPLASVNEEGVRWHGRYPLQWIYITTNCQQYCVLFASKYLICLDAISDTEIATTVGGSSGISNLKILRNISFQYRSEDSFSVPKPYLASR
jgi:hypothetical protein